MPYSTTATAAGSFGQTQTGDAADGQISLVQTGTDRYAELEQFANPSDAANAGIGAVAFSAVGAPEMLSTPVTDPTGSLQSVGDINQKYCFAAGTLVVCCEGAALGEGALLSEGALLGEGATLGDVWGPAILAAEGTASVRTRNPSAGAAGALASAAVAAVAEEDAMAAKMAAPHNTRLVPIEKIQPGDYVLAVPENDPAAEPRPCRVLQAFKNPPNIIWEIRIDAGIIGQTDVVRTTAGHPFFVKSKGRAARWTQVQDIQVGDRLRTPDGRWVIVDNVLCTKHAQEVFNMEVEDAHTYFVALPNSGKAVWVHNASTQWNDPTDQKFARQFEYSSTKHWQGKVNGIPGTFSRTTYYNRSLLGCFWLWREDGGVGPLHFTPVNSTSVQAMLNNDGIGNLTTDGTGGDNGGGGFLQGINNTAVTVRHVTNAAAQANPMVDVAEAVLKHDLLGRPLTPAQRALALLPVALHGLPLAAGVVGDVLGGAGRPAWATTAGGFVNWMKNLQQARTVLTTEQADAVVVEAQRLGVDVRLDPPHPGTTWDVPHLNIGNKSQIHVEVPDGYDNPGVPKGSARKPR